MGLGHFEGMTDTVVDSAYELGGACSVDVEGSVVAADTAAADIAGAQVNAILAVEVVGTGNTVDMVGEEVAAWVSHALDLELSAG